MRGAILLALTVISGNLASTGAAAACLEDLRAAGKKTPAHESYSIRPLYQAARLLALRGDEEGCRMLLGRIQGIHEPSPRPDLAADAGLVRGQSMVGMEVRNLDDQVLGQIADVVVDPKRRAVAYLLVARGGFLGLGGELVAVPFERFRPTADRNMLVLDVPEEKLANAPALTEDDAHQMSARQTQIDQYWN